jgi:integrase
MCLYLTKRNSTYYFRRAIPPELRSVLGAREFTFSLGTKDKDEAKRLRSKHAIRTDRLIDEAWASLAPSRPSVAPPAAAMAISEEELEWEALDRQEMAEKEARREELSEYIDFLKDRLRGSTREMPRELRAFRYILEGHQFDYDLLSDQLRVARFEKQELERKLRPASDTGQQVAEQSPAPANSSSQWLDVEIIDGWAAERKPTQKSIDTHRRAAQWLYDKVGRKEVDQLKTDDFRAFKTKLIEAGQSSANIKMILSRVRTLMQWAFENGHVGANTAAGVTIKDTKAGKTERRPFDLSSLNAIFASPVYAKGERPTGLRGEAGYWLPLLGLFTGARLEELGQLRPADVSERTYADNEGKERTAWFIHIREDSEGALRLKNANSERDIPVHGELVRLGFLAFVTAAQEAKQQRLFPLLRPDKYGRLTAKWGEHWSVYRREVCGVTDRRMVFHSFRHTFKDYARLAGIEEGIQRQLMGHSSRDVADDYGSGHWDHQLVEAMKRYKVPSLKIAGAVPVNAPA